MYAKHRKAKIPGNSRGIELVSSSGKITTICPEGDRNVFMGWLNALRDIIGKLNLERYRRTRDREYRRDVSKVDPGRFGESTLDDIRSSVVDVDSYNVDVWDIDDSKSSGYNVDIFDDTDTVGDDPNRANTGINDLESSAYQKHVEFVEHMLYGAQVHLKQRMEMTIGRSMDSGV